MSVSPDHDPAAVPVDHLQPDRRQPLVARLSGPDLDHFWELMARMSQPFGPRPHTLRLWVDPVDNGLKVKVDEYSWSAGYGQVERR